MSFDKLQSPPYSNEDLAVEKPYVLKKLGFDEEEFEKIIEKEQVPHDFFRNEKKIKEFINKFKWFK